MPKTVRMKTALTLSCKNYRLFVCLSLYYLCKIPIETCCLTLVLHGNLYTAVFPVMLFLNLSHLQLARGSLGYFPLGVCACALPPVCSIKWAPLTRSFFQALGLCTAPYYLTNNFSPRPNSLVSHLSSRRPAEAAAWPAVASELVLPRPPSQSGPTRRDLNCHSGQLCSPNLRQTLA